MKSIIVIYIPFECAPKKGKKFGDKKLRRKLDLAGFETIVIIDPTRKKIKTEVFFNN